MAGIVTQGQEEGATLKAKSGSTIDLDIIMKEARQTPHACFVLTSSEVLQLVQQAVGVKS